MSDIMSYLKSLASSVNEEIEKVIPKDRQPKEVYGIIWDILERGGKRFRPALCYLCCEAVGGKGMRTLPVMAAIEMFHTFTLIHDDIEDDSEMRRGRPCLHKIYGVPLAINAGDGLFMMVWESLLNLDFPPEKVLRTEAMLVDAFRRVLEGQAIELNWYRTKEWNITEDDFFKMVEGKTGALIGASCEVGAYLGGASEQQMTTLKNFGTTIGVAFQIQDDVLNLTGKVDKYKKEIGGDISEGKRSLITLHTISNAVERDRKRLIEILDSHTKDKEEIKEAIEILKKYGSIDYAMNKAREIVENEKKKLNIIPRNEASKRLEELADFFITREV